MLAVMKRLPEILKCLDACGRCAESWTPERRITRRVATAVNETPSSMSTANLNLLGRNSL